MRVTGGSLRGRRIEVPPEKSVRPSSDRLRQTLFNILMHGRFMGRIDGAVVLDAFAGTGALGIEALSRGARRATFMDKDHALVAALMRRLADFDLDEQATVVPADATRPPRAPRGAEATLVLLDPPYASGLGAEAIRALDRAGWIAEDALIVLEYDARTPPKLPQGFAIEDTRKIGDSALQFVKRAASA